MWKGEVFKFIDLKCQTPIQSRIRGSGFQTAKEIFSLTICCCTHLDGTDERFTSVAFVSMIVFRSTLSHIETLPGYNDASLPHCFTASAVLRSLSHAQPWLVCYVCCVCSVCIRAHQSPPPMAVAHFRTHLASAALVDGTA